MLSFVAFFCKIYLYKGLFQTSDSTDFADTIYICIMKVLFAGEDFDLYV